MAGNKSTKEPQQDTTVHIRARIPALLYERLRDFAHLKRLPHQDVVCLALEKHLPKS